MTEDERFVIWVAGFFDGEGCVGVYAKARDDVRPQMNLVVHVVNTDVRPLDLIRHRFGGHRVVSWRGRPGSKVVYRWTASGKWAYAFLATVLPHVLVKRDQVDLAMKFWELPWRGRSGQIAGQRRNVCHERSDDQKAVELDISQRLKLLKRA